MDPDVANAVRNMTREERRLFRRIGGYVPACLPLPEVEWAEPVQKPPTPLPRQDVPCGAADPARIEERPPRLGEHGIPVWDDYGNRYPSMTSAARATGQETSSISSVLAGRQKTAGGRRWFRSEAEAMAWAAVPHKRKRPNRRRVRHEQERGDAA